MRIPKKLLVVLCSVALIMSLVPMTALAATAYNSSVVSSTVPATMYAGQVAYAKVTLKNTGSYNWTAARGVQLKEIDTNKLLPYGYKLAKTDTIKHNQYKTFTVKITAPATAGTYTLKLRLYRNSSAFGATYTKSIVVTSEKKLSSIAVTTQPTKTEYVVGEGLDLTGLVVTGTYSDASKAPVTVALSDVTGFDSSKPAVDQELTITKDGKTATFKVTILAAGVSSMKAINATQVLVKFNVPVNNAVTEGADPTKYTIGGVPVNSVTVAADKMSALLTVNAGTFTGVSKLYIVYPIKIDGKTTSTAYFTYVEAYKDTESPKLATITYPTYLSAKVGFSEPVQAATVTGVGAVVAVSQNGSAVALANIPAAVAPDNMSVTYDLSNAAILADKPITVTILGILDTQGNLMDPNPVTFTLTKTKADTTAPAVVSVEPVGTAGVKVTFSEKLKAAPTINLDGVSVTATVPAGTVASTDNIVWTATFGAAVGNNSIHLIGVAANYQDMSDNNGAAYSKYFTFTADTAKPTISSVTTKQIGAKLYAVINFSEPMNLTNAALPIAGTNLALSGLMTKDYVTADFNLVAADNTKLYAYTIESGADADSTTAVMFDITSDVAFPAGASYVVTFPACVSDLAGNTNAAVGISFAKGSVAPVADTTAPSVMGNPAFSANNTLMTVAFSEDMDYATACNVANYKVGGVSIFSSAIFYNDAKTVRLTVMPGSITLGGTYAVTISGVKDKAGNLLDLNPTVKIMTVPENVKPYVASAQFTDLSTIKVNFSEAMGALPAFANGFEIYKNGVKLDVADITSQTMDVATHGFVTIVLADPITSLSDVYTVKLVQDTLVDTADNLVTAGVSVNVSH